MASPPHKVGIIGLGVMGSPFALNILEHEMSVVAYDNDLTKIEALKQSFGESESIAAVNSLEELIKSLAAPRSIFLFVPAGGGIDELLEKLLALLDRGDTILDCGNSHFADTDRRCKWLSPKGIHFLGTGISGGAAGARFGPSIMPGGDKNGFRVSQHVLEKVAAQYRGESCMEYLGENGAGHFTKMVHNGIEYGLMQLIAETYGFLRNFNYSAEQLHNIFSYYNSGPLASYLMEITAKIFTIEDPHGPGILLDKISEKTGQKGTGRWTVQSALELGVPVPTISAAVDLRNLSNEQESRIRLHAGYQIDRQAVTLDEDILERVYNALLFGYVITFSQGFELLNKGSAQFEYGISASAVARLWRAGCIIRTKLLDEIAEDLNDSSLPHLIAGENMKQKIKSSLSDAEYVVHLGIKSGYPMPALTASYSYFLALISDTLPSNLIQAQRDYFGGHGYERTDHKGTHSGIGGTKS